MNYNYLDYDIIVIGAGLSGAVIAERFANILNKKVLIIEKRDHIAGNCYDFIDEETNILCSLYGPHYFHTNIEKVWTYVNKFDEWFRHEHCCVANVDGKIVTIPPNLRTINSLCNINLKTEEDVEDWLKVNKINFDNITNGEQMAKSRVGEIIYEKIFETYTFKQWGMKPNELKPEVLSRIPIRTNADVRYFTDKYQALPKNGFTSFVNKIISNENINIKLNTDYNDIKDYIKKDKHIVIYTGPIDHYFNDKNLEKLEYRSINFKFERYKNMNFYQTHAQINYTTDNEEFTRITEYKHNYNQHNLPHTIITKEYSCDNGEPYYPVLNEKNLKLYEEYKTFAEKALKDNIHFIGRLANYKYFNMDQAIDNALNYFEQYFLY